MNNNGKLKKARLRYSFTGKIEETVLNMLKDHPDWSIPQIHYEVNKICNNHCPGLRAFQNKVPEMRQFIKNDSLDRPWNIASLNDFPVNPDALPLLFEIESKKGDKFIIREAKWINYLYPIIKALRPDDIQQRLIRIMYFWGNWYSNSERAYEYRNKGTPINFDSAKNDAFLYKLTLENDESLFDNIVDIFTHEEADQSSGIEKNEPNDLSEIAEKLGAQIPGNQDANNAQEIRLGVERIDKNANH